MGDKLVTIATFADSAQASLAQQTLADNGIQSFLANQNTANVYSGLTPIAEIELQTLESKAQEALEILQADKQQEQ